MAASRAAAAQQVPPSGPAPAGGEVEALFAQCEERLGRFLAQVLPVRSLAEDVLQDTFVAALESRERLLAADDPVAWLFGIARNKALHAHRRGRRGALAVERLARSERDPADPAGAVAVRDLLTRHLSPEDRTLVVLRYLHGFGAGELAAMTGSTPDAVRQRLSRASRRIIDAAGRSTT